MFTKIFKRLVLIGAVSIAVIEALLWIFGHFETHPARELDLVNNIDGFKKDVHISMERGMIRTLGWTKGEKPPGTVRILVLGGTATFAMLQNAEDTWWGQLKQLLEKNGLKVEIAAIGEDRLGIINVTARAAAVIDHLKPDIIISNFGFDDVIVHPIAYKYDKGVAAAAVAPAPPESWKDKAVKYSQILRVYRWWKTENEMARIRNENGRTDHYKKFLENQRFQVQEKLQGVTGIPRPEGHDPLLEYLDGLAALRDTANRLGAALILTGEASLHDKLINLTQQTSLMAYIPVELPVNGQARVARPTPEWVQSEMDRYSFAAGKFAEENKLPWIDLNGRVERITENFFSDVMLTDKGAKRAGEELLSTVLPIAKAKLER